MQTNCSGYCMTHVKLFNSQNEDSGEATKVRVRVNTRLLNGFCRAILSPSRDEPVPLFGGSKGDDNKKPAALSQLDINESAEV